MEEKHSCENCGIEIPMMVWRDSNNEVEEVFYDCPECAFFRHWAHGNYYDFTGLDS